MMMLAEPEKNASSYISKVNTVQRNAVSILHVLACDLTQTHKISIYILTVALALMLQCSPHVCRL